MLIGLMSLPNQVVYVQFHPIAYMVKLYIEMSMADLIVKVARSSEIDVVGPSSANPFPQGYPEGVSFHQRTFNAGRDRDYVGNAAKSTARVMGHSQLDNNEREDIKGISRQTEVQVYVADSDSDSSPSDRTVVAGPTSGRISAQDRPIQEQLNFSGRQQEPRFSDESQVPLKDLPGRPTAA